MSAAAAQQQQAQGHVRTLGGTERCACVSVHANFWRQDSTSCSQQRGEGAAGAPWKRKKKEISRKNKKNINQCFIFLSRSPLPVCPFFFFSYIHNTVVYSLSHQISGSFLFLSELNKCSLFSHTSAITVCFPVAKLLQGSHQQPSQLCPSLRVILKAGGARQSSNLVKGGGLSSSICPPPPHLLLARWPHQIPFIELKQRASRSQCCLRGLWVMLKSA